MLGWALALPQKINKTVLLLLALAACDRRPPAPAGAATDSSRVAAPPQRPTVARGTETETETETETGTAAGEGADPLSLPAPPASAKGAPEPRKRATGSAYFGCGEPIPHQHLWDETSEGEVLDAIESAKACALEGGRRLLLEFVAPWCEDCLEMAKLDETAAVAEVLQRRFERVRINVGKWDRHEALREKFGVRALATYVVIDPRTSKLLARTTLEPISKGRGISAERWAAWLETH